MQGEFCKKLVWQEPNKEKICLYGLITAESETHLTFKTAHKKYFLNKSFIIKLEDTNRVFISSEVQQP